MKSVKISRGIEMLVFVKDKKGVITVDLDTNLRDLVIEVRDDENKLVNLLDKDPVPKVKL